MPVGRSLVGKTAGNAQVVGSLVISLSGTAPVTDLQSSEQAIAQSREDVSSRGGMLSSGPQQSASVVSLQSSEQAISRAQDGVRARGGKVSEGPNKGGPVADPFEDSFPTVMRTPERMYILSVDQPKDRMDAQFNPESLRETVSTHWNRWDIPGLSHQPMQYGYTANDRFEFELVFDAGKGTHPINTSKVAINLLHRDLLLSWQYLRRQDDLGSIGDTQRLLFVWPNFISLTCVLTSVSFTYDMFNSIGQPTSFRAQIQLEEIRDAIMYSEDVQIQGSQRSGLKGENT